MHTIKIVIVEDQLLIRQAWINIFENDTKIKIVGESGRQDEAIKIIAEKRPDIVLLDINLEQGSGIDSIPHIRKISPGTRIIVVTMHSQPQYAKKMLKLGAKGYITKNSAIEEVHKAIDEVMQNRVYVCSEIKDILSNQILNSESAVPDIRALSVREMEIIKLITDGHSSKEISSMLHIGIRTVEVHRHNILKKLKLKNTASLINFVGNTDLGFL